MAELTLPVYDLLGKTQETVVLDPAVFHIAANPSLLHQAVVTYLSNRRGAIANTKDRSQVRGGGKKPWRQKGTGHARVGSIRSPLWRGGGITFGPTAERNYTLRMPLKMRQNAMKVALSSKAAAEEIIVIDSLASLDGKTKSWISALARLPKTEKNTLIIGHAYDENAARSIRNIPTQRYVDVASVTIYDIVRFSNIIITKDALEAITKWLVGQNRVKTASKTSEKKAEV